MSGKRKKFRKERSRGSTTPRHTKTEGFQTRPNGLIIEEVVLRAGKSKKKLRKGAMTSKRFLCEATRSKSENRAARDSRNRGGKPTGEGYARLKVSLHTDGSRNGAVEEDKGHLLGGVSLNRNCRGTREKKESGSKKRQSTSSVSRITRGFLGGGGIGSASGPALWVKT